MQALNRDFGKKITSLAVPVPCTAFPTLPFARDRSLTAGRAEIGSRYRQAGCNPKLLEPKRACAYNSTMTTSLPPLCIHHCTSHPSRFLGRPAELALLDQAFADNGLSVLALLGPGGQGKTAVAQHWLEPFVAGQRPADGIFLWSFYRGKDVDLCL